MTKLSPGDRIRFKLSDVGRKLTGIVADGFQLRMDGRTLVPVIRPQNRKRPACERATPLTVRWIPRNSLRKLPDRKLSLYSL